MEKLRKPNLRVALLQVTSGTDAGANIKELRNRLRAVAGQADLAVLPENVMALGQHETVRKAARKEADWHPILAELAEIFTGTVVFGGVPVKEDDRIYNSSLVLNTNGDLVSRYDKMHLFQLHVPGKPSIDETRLYAPGDEPVSFTIKNWRIVPSICYDLRFPELYRSLAPMDLILCTAAFTFRTGTAHWELLLRARAVENLCYAVGVGQCGTNPDNQVRLFGHSLVVAPWGELLEDLGTDPSSAIVTLDSDKIRDVRESLPALDHRRSKVL